MKKILLLGILIPILAFSQTDIKIEGLTINTPCELEYTRNLGNQNNYACISQDNNEKIMQYSVTVQNLYDDMSMFSGDALEAFKDQFFKSAKENAELNGDKTEFIVLINGQKALKIKSFMTLSELKFLNTSILFLHKQKSFVVNLTTDNLDQSISEKLVERIRIK